MILKFINTNRAKIKQNYEDPLSIYMKHPLTQSIRVVLLLYKLTNMLSVVSSRGNLARDFVIGMSRFFPQADFLFLL